MTQSNKTLLALALAALLPGCSAYWAEPDPQGYLDRRDTISLHAGDAVATNKVTQMIDPWPAYSANNDIAFNGQRVQSAVERYRNNKVIVPRGIASSSTYTPPADNSAAAVANSMPLVGPSVTQAPPVK